MSKSSLSLVERFWVKVQIDPNGCWFWLANKDEDGYGIFKRDGRNNRASAVAYEFAYGGVPEGMWTLHRCDNPSCVRPSHLFLGTALDNSRDMIQKARGAIGERNGGGVKMTNEKVITMRAQYATGKFTFAHLGRLYRVNEITAARICKRLNWKHVA